VGSYANLDVFGGNGANPLGLSAGSVISLSGAGDQLLTQSAPVKFDNATILLTGSDALVLSSALDIGVGGLISASGAGQAETVNFYNSGAMVNSGTVQANAAGAGLYVATTWRGTHVGLVTNTGLIAAANGGTVSFAGPVWVSHFGTMSASGSASVIVFATGNTLANDAAGLLIGGSYVAANGGAIELSAGNAVTSLAASVTLSGAGSEV
jgi:hypothetical protein